MAVFILKVEPLELTGSVGLGWKERAGSRITTGLGLRKGKKEVLFTEMAKIRKRRF